LSGRAVDKVITIGATEKIMIALNLIAGTGQGMHHQEVAPAAIKLAVASAIRQGFKLGCNVAIGSICGKIIGFNIAAFGEYAGKRFPLLVVTDLGVAKCSANELRLLDSTAEHIS
jgi:hypothetical protein